MSLAEAASIVRSCILSNQGDTTLEALKNDYYEQMGEHIPFKKLGFNSVTNLLEALPGIQVHTNPYGQTVIRAVSEKAAHIGKLVSKQSTKKKKKKQTLSAPMTHRRQTNDVSYGSGPAKGRDFSKPKRNGPQIYHTTRRDQFQPKNYRSQMPVTSYRPEMPVTSYGSKMPVTSYGSKMPVTSYGSKMPVTSYGSKMPVTSYRSKMPVTSYGTEKPVTSYGSKMPVTSYGPEKPVASYKSVTPVTSYGSETPVTSYRSEMPVTSYSPPRKSLNTEEGAYSGGGGGGQGYLPAGEEIEDYSDNDWFTDDEEFSPSSSYTSKSKDNEKPSGDLRSKLTKSNAQDFGKLQKHDVDCNAASRLIPYRSFKRPPYESKSKAAIERAMKNCPCCIFNDFVNHESERNNRDVKCTRDNLLITVKNEPSTSFKKEGSFDDDDDDDDGADLFLAKAVVDSLPDGWEPPLCVWEYYFLGDDFLIDFVADEMVCDYNETEIRSSCLCFSGFTITDAYEFLKILDWVPTRICVMLGYIDILREHLFEHIMRDMKILVQFLSKYANQVALCTLPYVDSANGYNAQIVRFNIFLLTLASDKVSIIDCNKVFLDKAGCIDTTFYSEKLTPVDNVPEPLHLWNDIGMACFYEFIYKELRDLYCKSIRHF